MDRPTPFRSSVSTTIYYFIAILFLLGKSKLDVCKAPNPFKLLRELSINCQALLMIFLLAALVLKLNELLNNMEPVALDRLSWSLKSICNRLGFL